MSPWLFNCVQRWCGVRGECWGAWEGLELLRANGSSCEKLCYLQMMQHFWLTQRSSIDWWVSFVEFAEEKSCM